MAKRKSVARAVVNKEIGQLESEVVKKHCDGIEQQIADAVTMLADKTGQAISEFGVVAKNLDLNIDRSDVKFDGTNVKIEFKFGIDRAKIEKRERSTAIANHLSQHI